MADILVKNPSDGGVTERYVDQGDGTWALAVVSGSAGALSGSDALVRNRSNNGVIERFADQGDSTKAVVWQTS